MNIDIRDSSLENGSSKSTVYSSSKINEVEEEREHFHRIVNAFRYYKRHSLLRVLKTEQYYNSLPEHHRLLLKNYKKNLDNIRQCIDKNDRIISLIIHDVAHMFENSSDSINPGLAFCHGKAYHPSPNLSDLEKVQATLKQFVRDWSEEGSKERDSCYQPIINEIVNYYPPDACSTQDVRILVPGAGLGRLAFEIAKRGYTCQGNEFSLFMLFASNFVLNKCHEVNRHMVFPWIHQYVNNVCSADQTHGVSFPDVNPSNIPKDVQFSMVAGDFLETKKDLTLTTHIQKKKISEDQIQKLCSSCVRNYPQLQYK